jgi:hypothetical protein
MSAPTHPLSDRAVSWLRTAVPVAWGTVMAAILRTLSPYLPGDLGTALATWLGSETTIALVTAAAIAGWYALWRWVEPRIPDWLTRLVLGSARPPSYAPVTPDGAHVITTLASSTPGPSVGRVVRYISRTGDGVESPAIVLRTRSATVPGVIDRWGPSPDGTLSGTGRPAGLVADLPDELTVDLLVHGLGGDYREYAVPHGDGPGSWSWPPRT